MNDRLLKLVARIADPAITGAEKAAAVDALVKAYRAEPAAPVAAPAPVSHPATLRRNVLNGIPEAEIADALASGASTYDVAKKLATKYGKPPSDMPAHELFKAVGWGGLASAINDRLKRQQRKAA